MTSNMRLAALCLSIALFLSPLLSVPCQAVPLDAFTGYSQGTARAADVVVNFAVLSPGDSFLPLLSDSYRPGTGATGLDPQQYTYLYQIANNSGPQVFDFVLNESVKATTVGSFDTGNFRLGFTDQGVAVTATGSFVQSGCSLAGPLCAGDGPGKNLDGSQALNFAGSTVSDAQRVTVSTALIPERAPDWAFASAQGSQGLTAGLISPLFGYQSSTGPLIGNGGFDVAFHDTGTRPDALFGIPVGGGSVSAPEPTTLLMFGSGLVGLLARGHTRRI